MNLMSFSYEKKKKSLYNALFQLSGTFGGTTT